MVRPLNVVYPEGPEGIVADDENRNCKLKARYWAAIIILGLFVLGVIVYISVATYTVDRSLPHLRTRNILSASVKHNRAHTALQVGFEVPSAVSVSPSLGTFVLSTNIKNRTVRAVAYITYNILRDNQPLLLEFLSTGFSSINKPSNKITLLRLDGDFKMNVKPNHFPLIPKRKHHESFMCRFLFKGLKLDEVDHQQCYTTTPVLSSSWH